MRNTQAIWSTQAIRKKCSWGCHCSNGEEFGGSHDHNIGHGAFWKTKVSTFLTDHGQGMLMGSLGSFGASPSLKIHSFKNGCTYIPNFSESFWTVRQMVWGSSVTAAPCTQVSSTALTVLEIQSGAKVVVYQATCPYPFWDGKCFIKSSLLEQGFLIHLGHNGQSFQVHRNPLDDDVSMAGAEEGSVRVHSM